MRLFVLPAVAALAATAGAFATTVRQGEASLLIRNVTIISMTGIAPQRGSVLVRAGRIVAAGPSVDLSQPNATFVDGSGKYLVPGLIDLHTHVSKTRGSSLLLLAAHGVTTVRDLGGDHEELLRWRKEITAGSRIGPRLLIAGPYLESAANAKRQHDTPVPEMVEPVERTRIGVGSPADAEQIVARLAARGVDHIKIRTTHDRETYLAIGAAARRHGLRLAGHWQPYRFDDLFASGQRSIEHGIYPPLDSRTEAERRQLFERMARAGIAVVPTLVVLNRLSTPDDAVLKKVVEDAEHPVDGKRLVAAYTRADWREQLAEQGPDRADVYGRLRESQRREVRDMRAAGVRVLAGTDVGVLALLPGRALHEELALLVREAGLSPLEALRAATADAAAFMGIATEAGTIAAGKSADLVMLEANPLDDIARISQIAGVSLRGRWFDRAALSKLIDEAAMSPDIQSNDWMRAKK